MKTLAFGISACLAVALLTMAQAPVTITPGSANQVLAVDGTAAMTGIGYAAEPSTGFRRSSAGTMTFDATGSDALVFGGNSTGVILHAGSPLQWGSSAVSTPDLSIVRRGAGEFGWTAVAFASLGTPANGSFAYCSDCTIANPCASGGSGALAKRLNGVWVCN